MIMIMIMGTVLVCRKKKKRWISMREIATRASTRKIMMRKEDSGDDGEEEKDDEDEEGENSEKEKGNEGEEEEEDEGKSENC